MKVGKGEFIHTRTLSSDTGVRNLAGPWDMVLRHCYPHLGCLEKAMAHTKRTRNGRTAGLVEKGAKRLGEVICQGGHSNKMGEKKKN